MIFEFNAYSCVLLVGFINILIYGILLILRSFNNKDNSGYWLSFFLILSCLYILPWMLGFAGWYNVQIYRDFLLYFPSQQILLIGPVIFVYTQELLNEKFKINIFNLLHFVPQLLYNVYVFVMYVVDKYIFETYYFYKNGLDKDFDSWYQTLGELSMIIYFILCLKAYDQYQTKIYDVTSFADQIQYKWVKSILIVFLSMILIFVFFDGLAYIYPTLISYESSWWKFALFSIVMYYVALTGYTNHAKSDLLSDVNLLFLSVQKLHSPRQMEVELGGNIDSLIKNDVSVFTKNEIADWRSKIQNMLLNKGLYREPDLVLSRLAKELGTNSVIVSKAINQAFNMNFNDLVNSYRVDAVISSLLAGAHHKRTLLSIAHDCGFNSKTTFNRAFKKYKGLSPKDYMAAYSL